MKNHKEDSYGFYITLVKQKNPEIIDYCNSETEEEFILAVESIVCRVIKEIESRSKLYCGHDELQLSNHFTHLLIRSLVDCSSEEYRNGHVDIVIKHVQGKSYQYLGECKIYNGYKYHIQGCDQLLNRYSSGRDKRGFVLEFFKVPDMYGKMKEVRHNFDSDLPLEQLRPSEDYSFDGAFVTEHKHFTGNNIQVFHLCCNTYHPEAKTLA